MSAAKLQAQCLGSPADSILVTCHEDAELVGHVFAATWTYEGGEYYYQNVWLFFN